MNRSRLPIPQSPELSEIYPTIGSVTASQNVPIATQRPTSVPGIPATLVPKNISKVEMVWETAENPRFPKPYPTFFDELSLST